MPFTTPEQTPNLSEYPPDPLSGHGREERWGDDAVIDQVLRLIADHHAATGATLGRPIPTPTPAELRAGPLGRDLLLLAAADRGAPPAAVRAASARVLDLLLRPLALDERSVPAWFWTTGVGRLVARAERAVLAPGGLLTPAEAAARLGAERATVEAWLAAGLLASVGDEDGRPLVPSAAVEGRRLVALELVHDAPTMGDVMLAERPLAS